jgi:hypothetical protein
VRIWDVPPGYLNRQSLLGEHRELHGLHSILVQGKRGYSHHPETLRWVGCLSGLCRRHALLAAEMHVRGYTDRTPIATRSRMLRWPRVFVTPPSGQYDLLGTKYVSRGAGRIPLPRSAQELWAHHKYSAMARDVSLCRELGRRVARMRRGVASAMVAEDLVLLLRTDPPRGALANAIEHLWGYVSKSATLDERRVAHTSPATLLRTTSRVAMRTRQPYLLASTALSELLVFVAE